MPQFNSDDKKNVFKRTIHSNIINAVPGNVFPMTTWILQIVCGIKRTTFASFNTFMNNSVLYHSGAVGLVLILAYCLCGLLYVCMFSLCPHKKT